MQNHIPRTADQVPTFRHAGVEVTSNILASIGVGGVGVGLAPS